MNLIKNTINSDDLQNKLFCATAPLLIDVRRAEIFSSAKTIIPTAKWQDHQQTSLWGREIDDNQEIVIYCAHGHQLSQVAISILRNMGKNAIALEGGIEAWELLNAQTINKQAWCNYYAKSWMTSESPTADSLACAWFIKRFINSSAVIHYLQDIWVEDGAIETESEIFAVNNCEVLFRQSDQHSCLNVFIEQFEVQDPALFYLSKILSPANSKHLDGTVETTKETAGLLAILEGLSGLYDDDLDLQAQAFSIFDALYLRCKKPLKKQNNIEG